MTSGKILFTAKRVADFSCPEGKVSAFLWDMDTKGLGLKASSGGSKQYVLETRLHGGQSVRLTIGKPSSWTIDAARTEARRLQVLVDQGLDPRELAREKVEAKVAAKAAVEAEKRAAEIRQRYTLRALCAAYVDYLELKGKNKTSTDVRSAFKVHVLDAYPVVAELPAREVTSHQIAAMVRKVREGGKERTAGILRSYLVAAFNAARRAPFDSGMSSDFIEFQISTNPAEVVPAIPVRRGDRTLLADELRTYLERIGTDEVGLALLVALLIGGQRIAQLFRAKVNDFDADTATLRLWDGKGKRIAAREHLVPVGPRAESVIRSLIARRGGPTERIFAVSERAAGDRVSSISKDMQMELFDLRDIRRTVETMMAPKAMGIDKGIRGQLMSHGIGGVQDAHYDRYSYYEEKRAALLVWEARLEEIQMGIRADNAIQQQV